MKISKIFQNPLLLIASFLFIVISGESFGGFYLLYLLMALPHGSLHSLLAVLGIVILITGYIKNGSSKNAPTLIVFYTAGVACIISSLLVFFLNDKQGYNNGTFHQLIPLISLIIFSFIALGFIFLNIFRLSGKKT